MEFRCHGTADHPAIAELRWLLKTDDGRRPEGRDKAEFLRLYQRQLEESDRRGDTCHWVIEDGDAVVGVMTIRSVLKELSPGRAAGGWGYLTNCFVMQNLRNRGHGTRLLEAVKTWAEEAGLELLIVWPSEASTSFYRRAGFTGRDEPLQLVLVPDDD